MNTEVGTEYILSTNLPPYPTPLALLPVKEVFAGLYTVVVSIQDNASSCGR